MLGIGVLAAAGVQPSGAVAAGALVYQLEVNGTDFVPESLTETNGAITGAHFFVTPQTCTSGSDYGDLEVDTGTVTPGSVTNGVFSVTASPSSGTGMITCAQVMRIGGGCA
jgi:hypothetical protein